MSVLYLADKNVVDHAFIDEQGHIHGGSFSPCYYVKGELDKDEQVVVDFSKGKKLIKSFLDDAENGMDHKLWITPTSNCTIKEMSHPTSSTLVYCQVTTPFIEFIIPKKRLFFVDNYLLPADPKTYSLKNAGVWFERFLNKQYADYAGSRAPKVVVVNNENFNLFPYELESEEHASICVPFRYTHGLKFSSSWGCRNPAHGHLSYMQLISTVQKMSLSQKEKISDKLRLTYNDAIFIFRDNVVSHTDKEIVVEYFDYDQVYFKVTYKLPDCKVYVVDKETTIENLVDFMAVNSKELYDSAGICKTFVSEGLCKGAYWERT